MDGKEFKLNYKPKELKPVTEYLKPQARFRHMTEGEISEVQQDTTSKWQNLLKADEMNRVVI
jgi:pyruvate ferredoxin oxidoreductase beta subunit